MGRLRGIAVVWGMVVAIVGLVACTWPGASVSPGATSTAPIAVLGTENFYADLLTQIGGSSVRASSLLKDPNVDPHSYEASPQAATLVADARLVILNGIGYDDFMRKLLDASPKADRVVIEVQQVLGVADDVNPHVDRRSQVVRTVERVGPAVEEMAGVNDGAVGRARRIPRELERNRLVPKPPPRHRLRDDSALVADDRIVDSRLACIAPHGLEHAARDEDDVNPGGARRRDRAAGALVQHHVLADQRSVEVARDRLDMAREVGRELQPCGFVRKSTSALRSFAGSDA